MGLGFSIFIYILSFVFLIFAIILINADDDTGTFLSVFACAVLFLAAHVPPSVGEYYLDEDYWSKYDYKDAVLETWYIEKETGDTVRAHIVEYEPMNDKYKLSNGHKMNASMAIKNSGGIRTKTVMRQDNPYGNWVWIWDRIKYKDLK